MIALRCNAGPEFTVHYFPCLLASNQNHRTVTGNLRYGSSMRKRCCVSRKSHVDTSDVSLQNEVELWDPGQPTEGNCARRLHWRRECRRLPPRGHGLC